jgi:hypothetical protein
LDIYWADFKLKVAENEKINRIMSELWASTYASETHDLWRHNHGSFDPFQPLAAIDRVCFRLPDTLSLQLGENAKPLQRHLAPHLDCCPHSDNNESMKWRPIQAFVSLSNTVEDNHGGFECCPNHHTSFGEWAETREWGTKAKKGGGEESVPPPCLGAFSPMRPKEDAAVLIHLSIYPFLSSSHRQSGAAGGVLVIAQKLRDSSAVDVQEVATTGGAFRAELLHEEHNVRLWQLSLL